VAQAATAEQAEQLLELILDQREVTEVTAAVVLSEVTEGMVEVVVLEVLVLPEVMVAMAAMVETAPGQTQEPHQLPRVWLLKPIKHQEVTMCLLVVLVEMEDMVATAETEEEVVEKSFKEGQEGQEPRAVRHWELRGALAALGVRVEQVEV